MKGLEVRDIFERASQALDDAADVTGRLRQEARAIRHVLEIGAATGLFVLRPMMGRGAVLEGVGVVPVLLATRYESADEAKVPGVLAEPVALSRVLLAELAHVEAMADRFEAAQ